MSVALELMDRGLVPDSLIRAGIRRLLRERLRHEDRCGAQAQRKATLEMVDAMRAGPIAVSTDKANEQHYEIPAEFFKTVLGKRLKYSAALWPEGVEDLDAAEEAMLELTCRRARVEDGMDILDLGCGWGSLSLWIAEKYPACNVLAVSNSSSQREFILQEAARLGLTNVEAITADMNDFRTDRRFHRVLSIEMFEHMRNVEALLARIATWLRPDGKLFVHVFCHREFAYFYEVDGNNDWMARNFFTGGYMPSHDLFLDFDRDLTVEERWTVNGRHYEKTLLAWLNKLDAAREDVLGMFEGVYGQREASVWIRRWRVFFMACAELFGYRNGQEWWVSHYLFRPRPADAKEESSISELLLRKGEGTT